MKITKSQLRRIIKEEVESQWRQNLRPNKSDPHKDAPLYYQHMRSETDDPRRRFRSTATEYPEEMQTVHKIAQAMYNVSLHTIPGRLKFEKRIDDVRNMLLANQL